MYKAEKPLLLFRLVNDFFSSNLYPLSRSFVQGVRSSCCMMPLLVYPIMTRLVLRTGIVHSCPAPQEGGDVGSTCLFNLVSLCFASAAAEILDHPSASADCLFSDEIVLVKCETTLQSRFSITLRTCRCRWPTMWTCAA